MLKHWLEQQQRQIDSLTDTLLQVNIALAEVAQTLQEIVNENRPTAH